MAGRYVIVEFDSPDQADNFVMKTLRKSEAGAPYRVVGYFYKPTQWCPCGPLSERQTRNQVYTNAKYGLRVHRICKRPRKEVGNAPRNLLDPINTPPQQITAFLTMQGNWHGEERSGQLLTGHPIMVAHNAGQHKADDVEKRIKP